MKNYALLTSLLITTQLIAGCASAPATPTVTPAAPVANSDWPQTVAEAVASPLRTSSNLGRDTYRHPQATLEFFGLRPDATVIEIWPSSGWYTEILAPFLATSGHYIAALPDYSAEPELDEKLQGWLNAHPEIKSKVTMTDFTPPKSVQLAAPGTVDMIVTFRNVHNWMKKGAAKESFQSFFRALKPGGILGVVEHRASTAQKQDPQAKSGYVREDYVIRLAKKAGFQLVAQSEINANPRDTKNYPEGVWTLPPSYRLKDKDHARYETIGESDRMTLKFVKPSP